MDQEDKQALILVMLKAFADIYHKRRVIIDHSYGSGVYCRYFPEKPKAKLTRVKKSMDSIIKKKSKIRFLKLNRGQIRKKFSQREDVSGLLTSQKKKFPCYKIGNFITHCAEPAASSTEQLSGFQLKSLPPGFVLNWGKFTPRPRLFDMIQEYEEWGRILGVFEVGRLNKAVKKDLDHLILLAEALHERKIAYITDEIIAQQKRLILIAGPSASGKTTFSKRLAIQLQVSKIRPVTISIDDYFLDRAQTPRCPDGSPDYECMEAINTRHLNRDLMKLLKGRKIPIPKFNFISGKSEYRGRMEKLGRSDVIILEGIHGLNERLTYAIDSEVKFKIYVSAITQLNIDDHNRFHTRDTRLIRRMVRDAKFRNHSPTDTLNNWSKVTDGEDIYIFPFQEESDMMFNSALIYELSILAKYAKPMLKNIKRNPEARRLYQLLSYFNTAMPDLVPNNSIFREFVGGSVFCY